MDKKDFQQLNRINRSIPRELIRGLVKNEKPFEYEKAKMEDISRNNRFSKEVRERAKKILDSGAYDRTIQVVDDRVAKKIERHIDREMNRKIRSGEIKPHADQWARKHMTEKKLNRR